MSIGDREYVISLTGKDSHKVMIPAGQGSFSIGTKGLSEGKYDVWVEPDSVIDWNAFNAFYTGYGEEKKAEYPYGDWPRWFYYSGNDTGFIEWSKKRKIEQFQWFPHTGMCVGLADANITHLCIYAHGHPDEICQQKLTGAGARVGEDALPYSIVQLHAQGQNCNSAQRKKLSASTDTDCKLEIFVGGNIRELTLAGALENFDIIKCDQMPYMEFTPDYPKENLICQLPVFPVLAQASALCIYNSPEKAAFDCKSLLQFENLKSLSLYGNLTNLDALAELRQLESIALRYVPDLERMPNLHSWEHLTYFLGYNIEETAGRTLRAELRQMKKERQMEEYSGVSKLRRKIWFETEYGIPFSEWEEKLAKKAARAYKSCFNQIRKEQTEEVVHQAVTEFIEKINRLDGIETTEREDVYTAILQFAQGVDLDISAQKWEEWFDEVREF